MNEIVKVFEHEQFGEIRALNQDGEIWFVAKDVCDALGLSNVSVSLGSLDEDERAKFNLGRQGDTNIISEAGLYSLVLRSRKPEAKAFKRWVTHDVLPSIRKTGEYKVSINPETDSIRDAIAYIKQFAIRYGDLDFSQYTLRTVMFTPDDAADALSHNYEKNRTIARASVDKYSHDMLNGNWIEVFGDGPIRFAADGTLLDGQQRLTAQTKANVIIYYTVQTCVPKEAFAYIDHNRPRSVADGFGGYANAGPISTLARRILNITNGLGVTHHVGPHVASDYDVREYMLEHYVELEELHNYGCRLTEILGISMRSTVTIAYWMIQQVMGPEFAEGFISNTKSSEQNIFILAQRLLKRKASGAAMKGEVVMGGILKCAEYDLNEKKLDSKQALTNASKYYTRYAQMIMATYETSHALEEGDDEDE